MNSSDYPNAILATSSFDRISGPTNAPKSQEYNNFRVVTTGQPLVQGQMAKITVSEIFYPYEIPTIVSGFNDTFRVQTFIVDGGTGAITGGATVNVTVPGTFYTGTNLAAAVNAALAASGGVVNDLTVVFDATLQSFRFEHTAAWDPLPGSANELYVISPSPSATDDAAALSRPDILWTMGFRPLFAAFPPVTPTGQNPPGTIVNVGLTLVGGGYPNVAPLPIFPARYYPTQIVGNYYTGAYTDYIDVCSPSLCQAQYIRDGNTNQYVVRRDLLCRLYIANETSTLPAEGQEPFVLHRQFPNPKVMRWTVGRSVDAIDLLLFDMYGQPLPTAIEQFNVAGDPANGFFLTSPPRDYSITFNVVEAGDGGDGSAGQGNSGYRY